MYVARLETGKQDPTWTMLQHLARARKVKVEKLMEYARRCAMSEHEQYAKAFFPITQRIRASFAGILKEESTRAVAEGLPHNVVLEGTLNTLLWFAARVACRLTFPAEDPDSTQGDERIARVQRTLSQTFVTIMEREKQRGHA